MNSASAPVIQYNFKNLYINNNKFYNLATKTYSATLFNNPSINVEGPKKGTSAISFNSIKEQYLKCSPFYTTNNGLSFALWFKADPSNITNWPRLFDFGNGTGMENILMAMPNKNLTVWLKNGENIYYKTIIPNICDNVWRHIVWTLDPNNGWQIYLNGSLIQTYSDGLYPASIMRNYQYIGRSNWLGDPYFNGCIADFRVYNTVINSSTINSIYNQVFDSLKDGELLNNVPLNAGSAQLYNEIFCDLYKTNKGFIQCKDCDFGDQVVYNSSTQPSEPDCLNVCSNNPVCTSYSFDFSKKDNNCSQYITFPNDRYKGVKNVNSGYDVSKFNYKYSELDPSKKKNVVNKCSNQYLNNIFLPNKNIDISECINVDNDPFFTKIETNPKCIYNLYKSNELNPPIENRVNYVDDPMLKISQGDEVIDNYYTVYNSFLEKQVTNSNINNLLNIDSNSKGLYIKKNTNPNSAINSDTINTIVKAGQDIVQTLGTNNESFMNYNLQNNTYSNLMINSLIFILIIIGLLLLCKIFKKKYKK